MIPDLMFSPSLIMIAGGIGSGKSVVSRILRTKGFQVYDCDSEAKRIMDSDSVIHGKLIEHIHPQAVVDGVIDRSLISNVVFANEAAMHRLNSIVHGAVLEDLSRWSLQNSVDGQMCFAECAIPVSSGLVHYISNIWEVTAPIAVRLKRVMARNALTEEQVEKRINAQRGESLDHVAHEQILNDGVESVLHQVNSLLAKSKMAH